MRSGWCYVLIVVGLSLPGCSFYRYAFHNTCHDIRRSFEGHRAERHRRQSARTAWLHFTATCSKGDGDSHDFKDGFEKGYIDVLTYDGPGEPPLIPPTKYWSVSHQNPAGRAALQSWNDGFRAGAAVARNDGQHDFQILPAVRSIGQVEHRAGPGIDFREIELPTPRPVIPEVPEGSK